MTRHYKKLGNMSRCTFTLGVSTSLKPQSSDSLSSASSRLTWSHEWSAQSAHQSSKLGRHVCREAVRQSGRHAGMQRLLRYARDSGRGRRSVWQA